MKPVQGGGGMGEKRVVVVSVVTAGGEDKHKVLLKSRYVAVTLLCFCVTISSAVFLHCVKMVKSAGSERVKTGFTGEGDTGLHYHFTIYQQQN